MWGMTSMVAKFGAKIYVTRSVESMQSSEVHDHDSSTTLIQSGKFAFTFFCFVLFLFFLLVATILRQIG